MALNDHLRLSCLIAGTYQTEMSQITCNGQSGAQAVETLIGLVGKTDGSKRLEITANFAVPIGGPEFDFWGTLSKGQYVDFQVEMGGKSLVSKGWLQEVTTGQSTNANTELTCHFIGELNEPQ